MLYFVNGSNSRNSDCVSAEPLRINSCGLTEGKKDAESDLLINRPQGRRDYQLLYIWRGQGRYLLDGRERLLSAGTVLLYRPGVPQIYSYRAIDRCGVGWIHFTGTLAQPLLERSGLLEHPVAQVGQLPEINRLLGRIIREYQRQEPQYQDQVAAYFIQMITLIGRRLCQQADMSGYERAQRVRNVMEYLHEHYSETLNVESCAQLCALSRYHFIHVFRQYTGQSPYAYLTDIRLTEAARLLSSTALPVGEIARRSGYEDALYFSRLFKKKYGQSPSAFREETALKGSTT